MPPIRPNALSPVRGYTPYQLTTPQRPHQGSDLAEGMSWTHRVPGCHGMGGREYESMQGVLSATVAHEARQGADAAAGCCYSSNDDAWSAEKTGYTNEDPYPHGIEEQWERLLMDIRSDQHTAPAAEGGAPQIMVGLQPADGVLRPQAHRSAVTSLWVVNPMDWIDVEHTLRWMLQCESIECHAFHTMDYIFFRSCAMTHVAAPGEFLQPGTTHRFADSGIAVEITRVHAEGILEVSCFAEYSP